MILLYGVVAVVWVLTMILACCLMIHCDFDTASMPWWKKWLINIGLLALLIYTLPLLIVMLVFECIFYALRRI